MCLLRMCLGEDAFKSKPKNTFGVGIVLATV